MSATTRLTPSDPLKGFRYQGTMAAELTDTPIDCDLGINGSKLVLQHHPPE